MPHRLFWGSPDNHPLSRLADVGSLSFWLNNSAGLYTPGGPTGLSGWKKGIPIKWVVTYEGVDHPYLYYLEDIQIKPNNQQKKIQVTCVDWFEHALKHPIVNPGIATDVTADTVFTTMTDEVAIQPAARDFDTGIETFATAFDTVTSKTKAYTEYAKAILSELGWGYLRKDKTYGETLVFENADARHGWRDAEDLPLGASSSGFLLKEDGFYLLQESGFKIILGEVGPVTFDGSIWENFEARYGEHVINRMTVYANPRRLDASAQILFQLDEPIAIGSGRTVEIKGTYANPDGGLPVNAQDMITPVITTDYLVNTISDGSGSNISADLVLVSTTYGTEGFTHRVRNDNAAAGYVTKYNTRGTGIYIYNPIEHAASNSDSIDEFETQSESLNQKYKSDLGSGSVFVESVVDEFNQPQTVLNWIEFTANKSDENMLAFLYTDIGNMRYIEIDELGITGNYYIQGIEATMNGSLIKVKWFVKAALSLLAGCGLTPIAIEYAGGSATDGVNFGYLPRVSNISERSWSFWIYPDAAPVTTSDQIIGIFSDDNGDLISLTTDLKIQLFTKAYANPGAWTTDASSVPTGQWVHVLVTYDRSSASNNPVIYIDGTSETVTETLTPSSTFKTEDGVSLVVGNWKTATEDYTRPFDGKIFDPRIYEGILTSGNATTLYNSGTPDETLLTDQSTGLLFQAFAVRTAQAASYIDDTLDSTMTVRDNIFGAIGTINGSPIGRAAP
jgi:hypothetical protein